MMAKILTIGFMVALAAPVNAEIVKLGDLALGQSVTTPKTVKIELFGCAGELRPEIDRSKKVVKVVFSATRCKDLQGLVAAITKDFGGTPIENTEGAKLWEGKTASVMLGFPLAPSRPSILLVPPGPGSKRACFADDGFAAFWSGFKTALATGKVDKVAPSFKFPLKNFEDKVVLKDAKALVKRWSSVFGAEDLAKIANGSLTAKCNLSGEYYNLPLHGSNTALSARRVGDRWLWLEIEAEP